MGGDQELLCVALRTRSGATWGSLGLYRPPGEPAFEAGQLEFMRAVARSLAEGIRHALLIGEARDPDRPDAPGLLVLSAELEVESATPGTERWIDDLPGGSYGGRLPAAVVSVAKAALRSPAAVGRRARSRWQGCCRTQARGSCYTEQRLSAPASRASP